MAKWRVEYERDKCIAAGTCVAADPDFWSIDKDMKATLKGSQFDEERKIWILEVEEGELLEKQREAAGVCPVNVIHIIDPTGKREI